MQPLTLTLKGFRGIRDGLGRDEVTLDFERLADGAQLIAIAGANGSGKTTILDSLVPFIGLPSRVAMAGPGGFSYYDHVYLPENVKDLTWAQEGRSYRSQIVIRDRISRVRPAMEVSVSSYADTYGSAQANADFTRLRAQAVFDVLVRNGIPAARIQRREVGAVAFQIDAQESRRVVVVVGSP